MNNCIFCKIAKGDIPSHKIYEDEHVFAFLDIKPNNPGHTLVIPKEHFENIYTIPDEEFARVSLGAKKIALAIKNSLDADGINLSMNNEEAAGQVIFHAHLHVIPRYKTDGFKHFPKKSYKDGEAEVVLEKIKKELE